MAKQKKDETLTVKIDVTEEVKAALTPAELERISIQNDAVEEKASAIIHADIMREEITATQKQEERERLIADASYLAGRVNGLNFVSKVVTVTTLMQLRNIKEAKVYKDMPNIGTWENYCKSIGFSKEKIDKDLENLATFGEDFLVTVTNFGIGYRELRQLKKATSDGTLSIESDSVIIEGEVIQLDDKDELKDALEKLVAEQNRKLKAKDAELADKTAKAEKAETEMNAKQKVLSSYADTINRLSAELEKTKTATIYSDGTNLENDPIYQELLKLEHETEVLFARFDKAARLEMSEFHQNMFGGVLMKFFKRLDDVRDALCAKDETHYFDNMYLTEADKLMVENMMTPSSYLHSAMNANDQKQK